MGGLGSGGGPLGHVMAVDFLFYFFLSTIVPPISLFAKWNVALRSLHPPQEIEGELEPSPDKR